MRLKNFLFANGAWRVPDYNSPKINRVFQNMFFLAALHVNCQAIDGKASFLLAGISVPIGSSSKVYLYGGYNHTDGVKAVLALPFFNVHKNISLMPGYMLVNISSEEIVSRYENHLLPSLILSYPINKFTISNRSMYFLQIRNGLDDLSYYRNRVGVDYSMQLAQKNLNFFIYEEPYKRLNDGKLSRNRVTLGFNYELTRWLHPRLWYILQHDRGESPRHLFFLFLTVPLEKTGLSRSRVK